MPEEVRRARTTGGTIHLQTSQEVKDGPEEWKSGREDGIGQHGWSVDEVRPDEIDKFDDDEAHAELERLMTEYENQDDHGDSEYEYLGDENYCNSEEKVCIDMKEMGVMDINSDELRGWIGYDRKGD